MEDPLKVNPAEVKKRYQRNCIVLIVVTVLSGLLIFSILLSAKAQLQSHQGSGNLLVQRCFAIVLLVCGTWLSNKSYFGIKYHMTGSFFLFPGYGRRDFNKYFGFIYLVVAVILIVAGLRFLI